MIDLSKPDFPPLFPAGFFETSLEELQIHCVDPFPDSDRRKALYAGAVVYFQQLSNIGCDLEIWIDGSFVTQKPEPDDIDVVVVMDPAQVDRLSPEKAAALEALADTNTVKTRFGLHVFFVAGNSRDGLAYWRGLFGYQRDGRTPKGMALIKVAA